MRPVFGRDTGDLLADSPRRGWLCTRDSARETLTEAEIEKASAWFAANLGPDVPWHFTAFHPDYKMLDKAPTPPATLARARAIARAHGLRFVYTGNVHDREGGSTWCPGCGQRLIERDWYVLGEWHLKGNRCDRCGFEIAGHFDSQPGCWGSRRVPVRLN